MTVKIQYGIPKGTIEHPIYHDQSYNPLVRSGDPSVILMDKNGVCPFLKKGQCSIYAHRPQVCRDYGNIPELPCQYLYPEEAKAKQDERIKRSTKGLVCQNKI
jgi:Fe-S-cluster containining protein